MTMRSLIFTLLIVGTLASYEELWREWKRKYNKERNGLEDAVRRKIWIDNVEYIQERNLHHDLGLITYELGLNQFTDMTFDEFKAKYLSDIRSTSNLVKGGIPYDSTNSTVPESIDWREAQCVTDVKNQVSKRSDCFLFR